VVARVDKGWACAETEAPILNMAVIPATLCGIEIEMIIGRECTV
jgi:hypothetical protein